MAVYNSSAPNWSALLPTRVREGWNCRYKYYFRICFVYLMFCSHLKITTWSVLVMNRRQLSLNASVVRSLVAFFSPKTSWKQIFRLKYKRGCPVEEQRDMAAVVFPGFRADSGDLGGAEERTGLLLNHPDFTKRRSHRFPCGRPPAGWTATVALTSTTHAFREMQ